MGGENPKIHKTIRPSTDTTPTATFQAKNDRASAAAAQSALSELSSHPESFGSGDRFLFLVGGTSAVLP